MFSKLAVFLASVAVLAAATPMPTDEPASSCSTGDLQCCETTGTASDPAIANELGILGIVVQDVDAEIGLTCSPISVIGVGTGGSCSASAVCCEDNSHGGLVSIGCVPVTL